MQIIVQKFGGTSLATEERRAQVAAKVLEAVQEGYSPVVVVSAIGRSGDPYATDTFLNMVKGIYSDLPKRELDLLMSCGEVISGTVLVSTLSKLGMKAVLMTGGQAGIITNNDFGDARIVRVEPAEILGQLAEGNVVVVTGFQGVTESGQVTTLGRGGSDTTASALGVALEAEAIDIYTDVEGIMTADPRIVENARILDTVTYNEICNLAYQGAKVIHPRAVEIAMQRNIPLRIKSTFSEAPGTLVTNIHPNREVGTDITFDRIIAGIAHTANVTQLKILTADESNKHLTDKRIFKAMALADISVDFISVQPEAVLYTVSNDIAAKAVEILENMDFKPEIVPSCAKVSIVGAGIAGVPGVMADMVEALSDAGVTILQSADSHTTIWVLVHQTDMVTAIQALHKKFKLDI
ncbi:aspartate kinase, monofunctional class [Desulfosporosinus orientis DSM 765]|uniref:Aspartokinase n=1 Tax=Desulfosporosinus orientis (strain ATCC 19365 / DSM 765 / NCIMB 8382 / VKM B-1628 / Singapore I) TaxID=768706 RepID=G7WC37_DESOD|nr:aspartate kinase [Desulfosporosinus orientis]AET70011.1 aspartate kinase, monofunctional class [Desulfosporosinus orientis DSM 765]